MKGLIMNKTNEINRLLMIAISILAIIILSMAATVLAQDSPPIPTIIEPIELGNMTPPSDVATLTLDVLLAALLIPGTAPLVNLSVSIGKRLIPDTLASGSDLAAISTIVIYGGFWLALQLNMETEFETSLNLIYQIGTVILGIVSTRVVAHKAYKASAETEIPILGYKRPVKASLSDVSQAMFSSNDFGVYLIQTIDGSNVPAYQSFSKSSERLEVSFGKVAKEVALIHPDKFKRSSKYPVFSDGIAWVYAVHEGGHGGWSNWSLLNATPVK